MKGMVYSIDEYVYNMLYAICYMNLYTLGGSCGYKAGITNVKGYVAPFQNPLSGLTDTIKLVKSFGFGKLILATEPPSSSAISINFILLNSIKSCF